MPESAGEEPRRELARARIDRPFRRMTADIRLSAAPDSVFRLEDFVDSLSFLDSRTRMRVKLAGEEILDNIIRHAPPVDGMGISIRIALRPGGAFLGFFFRSPAFASFAARCEDSAPLFDAAHRRWRGIGLVMCRNLASRVLLRSGDRVDRIFLSFPPERSQKRIFVPSIAIALNEGPRSDPLLIVK